LQLQLRALLHYHSGVRVFRTRQLMLDVQSLTRSRSVSEPGTSGPPMP
jgi:DNA repair protein RecO (recombination protein O)